MTATSTIDPPAGVRPRGRALPAWSALKPAAGLALAFALGWAMYRLHPAVITDDTYAFLNWGRDLRHGVLPPLLEQRTFHPLPIVAAALVTLLGSSAPTATMLLSLTALALLALAAWTLASRCGLRQPGPLAAAALVLADPALLFLGYTAYINIFFAVFVVWALVAELSERRATAWTLFIAAALVRPEGWAFLWAYGALRWWSLGHRLSPRRWIVILVLIAAPPALWIFLEWRLFGDPLYSFHVTTTPAIKATGTGTLSGISSTLREWVGEPALVAAALGIPVIALAAPRRVALCVLGTFAVAGATVLILASSNFNLPSRQYSAFTTLLCVLAAAGAMAPMVIARRWLGRAPAAALGAAGAALLLYLSITTTSSRQSTDFHFVRVQYETRRSLDRAMSSVRGLIDTRHAVPSSVSALNYTQVTWDLGERANVANVSVVAITRLIVQPSAASDAKLATINRNVHLRRTPRGWRILYRGAWTIFAVAEDPVRLGDPTPVADPAR